MGKKAGYRKIPWRKLPWSERFPGNKHLRMTAEEMALLKKG
jgi:hypothetical protein